jgi:hypothetical protein
VERAATAQKFARKISGKDVAKTGAESAPESCGGDSDGNGDSHGEEHVLDGDGTLFVTSVYSGLDVDPKAEERIHGCSPVVR